MLSPRIILDTCTDPIDWRDECDAAGAGDVSVVEAHAASRAQLQHLAALVSNSGRYVVR